MFVLCSGSLGCSTTRGQQGALERRHYHNIVEEEEASTELLRRCGRPLVYVVILGP